MHPLEYFKDLAIIAGGIVAFVTFISGALEFARQGRQASATHFVDMRRRFLETPLFRDISNLLATDDPALLNIAIQDRRNYGAFFEEVALVMNSGIIKREVAHYMFGYYVLLTARSANFWEGLDRDGIYWSLFREFASTMNRLADQHPLAKELRF